jgi:hypothetical protein
MASKGRVTPVEAFFSALKPKPPLTHPFYNEEVML